MLIKAGTYKWLDVLELDNFPTTECEINFTITPIPLKDMRSNELTPLTSGNYNRLLVENGQLIYRRYEDEGGGGSTTTNIYAYVPGLTEMGLPTDWDGMLFNIAFGLDMEMPFCSRYGQIIDILEDVDVPTEWSDIFNTCLSSYTPPEVSEGEGATITYNGRELLSNVSGQTKTLKCAGKKMKTDIVITT